MLKIAYGDGIGALFTRAGGGKRPDAQGERGQNQKPSPQ
jgi:hypothetical protein